MCRSSVVILEVPPIAGVYREARTGICNLAALEGRDVSLLQLARCTIALELSIVMLRMLLSVIRCF